MVKRSPRYPRQNLAKSLEMVKKMFDGAHQSKLDTDTAARVIGYSNSASGAASSALGALRQYGLVDGLRGDLAVSNLAMRILQPLDEDERSAALHEAALKPEIFERILAQFNGKIPPMDEPIKAYLIRNEDFSASGAQEVVETLRQTLSFLPQKVEESSNTKPAASNEPETNMASVGTGNPIADAADQKLPQPPGAGELITLPLGLNCKAEVRLIGKVTHSAYDRLIRHLELLRDIAAEDSSESAE